MRISKKNKKTRVKGVVSNKKGFIFASAKTPNLILEKEEV
jgi:hypothetical protein